MAIFGASRLEYFLAHWDYGPGEFMLSFSRLHRRLSAVASASTLAQCLNFQNYAKFFNC